MGLLVTVDSESFESRFVGADEGWRWTFAEGARRQSVLAGGVVRWGEPAEPARGPVVVTADGGLLPCEVTRIDRGRAALETDAFGAASVPLESLAGVAFAWPGDRAERDRLVDRLSAAKGSSDVVWLINGDRLSGVVADVNDRDVRLESGGQVAKLPRDRVVAVAFNPALRSAAKPTGLLAWIGLDDGTRLLVRRLRIKEATLEVVPIVAGPDAAPWTTEARRCVFVQPLGGRVVYLSDRAADGFRHIPFLELPWTYQNNRNVLGGRLAAGGRTYLKGLGVHSSARLTYSLDEPYERFESTIAIDDAAHGGGSVRFYVFVDGRRRFTSDLARGGDRPVDARVELTGAKRLDLIVDFGERADQLDYADWLDARIIRADKSEPRP